MAASARSLQHLFRAAFSLSNAASTSAATGALGVQLAAGTLPSPTSGGAMQLAAAGGLRQLVRHFHSAIAPRSAVEEGSHATPSINPLQQAPSPAPGHASPLGPLPFDLAAIEPTNTSRAVTRGIAMSPRKLNDFAKVVRGLHVEDALIQCRISPKKSAKVVEKALLSARANAIHSHGLEPQRLSVAEAWVGKGQHLKRISMHGRGRSGQRLRYRSHLTVVLREEEQEPRRRTRIMPMLAERYKAHMEAVHAAAVREQ